MSQLSESSFNQLTDSVYEIIRDAFEHIAATYDCDLEVEQQGNVLEIIFPDQRKIIMNTQRQWQEIWLACPLGAAHFALQGDLWFSARENTDLGTLLSQWGTTLLGQECHITALIPHSITFK